MYRRADRQARVEPRAEPWTTPTAEGTSFGRIGDSEPLGLLNMGVTLQSSGFARLREGTRRILEPTALFQGVSKRTPITHSAPYERARTESEPMPKPKVSVIIPTIGRPSILRAIESVRRQSYENVEIIVSVDGPLTESGGEIIKEAAKDVGTVIRSSVSAGPGMARLSGVEASTGSFVAFLDDDDAFLPYKLERQVARATHALRSATHVVVGCRVEVVDDQGRVLRRVPRRPMEPGESLTRYLFRRTQVRPRQTAWGASMILSDRALAAEVSSEATGTVHEDWSWLLAAERVPDTVFSMCEEVLLSYSSHTRGSGSHRCDTGDAWRNSRNWFRERRDKLSVREYGDGVLCISGARALQARDMGGTVEVVVEAVTNGQPGSCAWVFFVASAVKELLGR